MKQDPAENDDSVTETAQVTVASGSTRKRKPKSNVSEQIATTPRKTPRKSAKQPSAPETPVADTQTPRKRGRKKKKPIPNGSTATPARRKPTTKAGLAATNEQDDYSYADLFPGDAEDQEIEEDAAADDDSEYAPSEDEVRRGSSSKKRSSVRTRRQTRNRGSISTAEVMVTESADGSTDEDEAGESESEYDEDDEDEINNEKHELEKSSGQVALFEDDTALPRKDVYDFDAQSIISDQRAKPKRKSVNAASRGRVSGATARSTSTRTTRRALTGQAHSWGSNIYSALAASLRTRADLDAYSTFLKSTVLNTNLDQYIAEMCKPSGQHANLFYGVSASLQSLMGRINDYDKVVELLYAFVARPLDQMLHRVACLVPVIHQPLFGVNYIPSITTPLQSLVEKLDPDMTIRPAYLLNPDTTLLAMPYASLNDFGISNSQYTLITGTGNMGRFTPEIKQLVIASELFNQLTDLIHLPPERVYEVAFARAHQQTEESDIDTSPIEPPDLQRLVIMVNSKGALLGFALLDNWNTSDVPANICESQIQLTDVFVAPSSADSENHQPTVEQVSGRKTRVTDENALDHVQDNGANNSDIGQIHCMDAFIMKPNGRRDQLLLIGCRTSCFPPFPYNEFENAENIQIYSLLDEGRFLLEKHGFAPEVPLSLEGVHTAEPEELLDTQSLVVVPDLLYDTLRKVMLQELITSTGATTAVLNAQKSDSLVTPAPVMQCTKFIILERIRRVPLAVVFDSPVRLSLQITSNETKVHPIGEEASQQFDKLTPAELESIESAFIPTTSDYRLVTINGLLFGLQIDDQRIVRRVLEVAPARLAPIFPNNKCPSLCGQSVLGESQSCSASVRIVNDETDTSTVLPAFFYPHYNHETQGTVVTSLSHHFINNLYNLPLQISLYDVMFRLGQKHMPELLARQHIEAAEAAAYAEAQANPHVPPPAPVPVPEHWSVCCICSKELRSYNGLLEHEMRHVGLSRYRCLMHNMHFNDRRQWQEHMKEMHSTARSSALSAVLPLINSMTTTADSGSEAEEEEIEEVTDKDAAGSGLLTGLSRVFSMGVLIGRMEAPQCDKCGDYFLNADLLTQHLDLCDGISFALRTPITRSQQQKTETTTDDQNTAAPEVPNVDVDELGAVGDEKTEQCVCGMCGSHLPSRERILRHFSVHLQCILCNAAQRSLEELSTHYQNHLSSDSYLLNEANMTASEFVLTKKESVEGGEAGDENAAIAAKKSLLQKLMVCDICSTFVGTKYNYYFHQWVEHGVVHPSTEGARLSSQQTRPPKQSQDQDDYLALSGVRRIKCKFCGQVVRVTGKDYITHLGEKHGVFANSDVICRVCGELFETPEHLSTHLGLAHVPHGAFSNAGVQTIYRCPHCEFWAFNKGIQRHARDSHGDNNPAMYECTHCYERFSDKRFWRSHMDKHNEGYSQRCVECGRAFRLRSSLLHHIRTHHGEDQGPATCEYCGLTYPKRGSLRYHIFRMHNQELAHECTMCQRRFRLETELRRHVKEMHSGAVRCEICHKVCTNLRCYAQHRQKHFRTRLYQCTDCQTTFKSKLAMKRHIRVEHLKLGPERFECQICGKIVTQIGMHMLIHKEARFECEYCNKRFTKQAYYNEHLRIHWGEQPFECHICHKRFNKKSNLNVHVRFHEKHRDEDGNYLELKPRGRVSHMFGDALMSPDDRAARQLAASRQSLNPAIMVDSAVGSDIPGAFNVSLGPPLAAEEAAARAVDLCGMDCGDCEDEEVGQHILYPTSKDDVAMTDLIGMSNSFL